MKLCFIVDARSSISRSWMQTFLDDERYDVSIISTRICDPTGLEKAKLYFAPVGLTRFANTKAGDNQGKNQSHSLLLKLFQGMRSSRLSPFIFYATEFISAIDTIRQSGRIRGLIQQIQPDLIHAMRIPFEGILAGMTIPENIPLLISVWGADFTLFAKNIALIGRQTRNTMQRANALHSDCHRDIDLATHWSFDKFKPYIVVPGTGGIQSEIFFQGGNSKTIREKYALPNDAPIIINPRGRGTGNVIRNDVFFQSIPLVLQAIPDAIFIGVNMKGNPIIETWIDDLKIRDNVRLTGILSRQEMADLFRLSHVSVSPSTHDGTPNTLLEAMASGCVPVVGDNVESVKEWVKDGENGLLFNVNDPMAEANAILRALNDSSLRERAIRINQQLVSEQADYHKTMERVRLFYEQILNT